MKTILLWLNDLWTWLASLDLARLASLALAFDDPDDWDVDLGGSECCIQNDQSENDECCKSR